MRAVECEEAGWKKWEKPENSNPFSLLMDDQFSVERQEGQAAHLFLAVFPASETTAFPLVDKNGFSSLRRRRRRRGKSCFSFHFRLLYMCQL